MDGKPESSQPDVKYKQALV